MKNLAPALTALYALCAVWCAPAIATPAAQGSTVLAPPLMTKGAIKNRRPMTVLRLPTQAGKVSKIVTTNLVSNSPSWIAKGDKYYSLCAPNRQMVACAPIVATSVMRDIEVGALAGPKGAPLLTFKIAPGARQAPKRIVYAMNYFLARTNKQVAHFNRKAVSYAPKPGTTSVRLGPTSSIVEAGGGGGCSYDDFGSYDCSGGAYTRSTPGTIANETELDPGREGGGYDGGYGDSGGGEDPIFDPDYSPDEPIGQCTGACDYPFGDNNGAPDPCIDANGNAICTVVTVQGERPTAEEPMGLPTCRPIGPFTIECGSVPPMVGGEPDLPTGPTPWFPQTMCNFSRIFCSAGQEPSDTGKTLDELLQNCEQNYDADIAYCDNHKSEMDPRMADQCYLRADRVSLVCRERAKSITGNGAHTVP